jgi:hypothetical protein
VALSTRRDAAGYRDALVRIQGESARLRHLVDDMLWLAGSRCRVAGLKAQIADTAESAAPDRPDSWVVPRPGAGRRAAGLSPSATNTSPSAVTAAAPASGSAGGR